MKKVLIVIVTAIIVLAALATYYKQSRDFYCLPEGKCITVWKRIGGKCYVIPRKYYGISIPKDNFIETTNTQFLSLYFVDTLPQLLIVKDEGTSQGTEGKYMIHNRDRDIEVITDYSKNTELIIYPPGAQKHSDVNANVYLMNLNIFENYATDKKGKKL